ncbi:D-alanyl-D-alanine endopeptidase (penicillin-binding protein 7) [Massilia aurea]|uniref:D-alanyl-D-alanine endopeptidase (Penicillin-binding protein 7) n=1 Tax=Massilia aurea TaxID=373040 RepID=A0A7X0CFJ9_9BURK|nr:D-alanyl-D-alanine endopeptidase [Massilia aurea]MBB6135177.1 D-alanyl-D-alanine endopeptidase (penicillin-binding protein 7) [Massilia aurea]
MFKLAVAAVVAALFAFSPVQAAGAGAGAGAGATEQAKKSSAAKKKVKRKVVRKTTATRTKKAKRQELAAADDRPRMIRRVKTVRGKRVVTYQPVRTAAAAVAVGVAAKTVGDMAGLDNTVDPLALRSNVAYVVDQNSAEVLFEKNANVALPIASLTKLMTGMVVMDSKQDLDEVLRVTDDDVDRHKFSSSRLPVGASMTRRELLHIALMSSENRAASALGRNYPGGISAFVGAMNAKARQLGMRDTHYVDSSGLSSRNVSSGRDLAKLVMAAHGDPVLREFSTTPNSTVQASGRTMHYRNTNYLVSLPDWNIGLQKTGFINEAGRCLVMQAMIHGRNVVMVFLDSKGKMSRTADAGRIRRLIESLPDRMDVDAIRPSTITASAPGLAR